MHREPYEWQRAKPEDQEGDEVVDCSTKCDCVVEGWAGVEGRPDAGNHEVDAFATNPGLDPVPDAIDGQHWSLVDGSKCSYQAMTDLFSTGHREPQIPNDALLTTGKLIWYVAPILPVRTTKNAAIV